MARRPLAFAAVSILRVGDTVRTPYRGLVTVLH